MIPDVPELLQNVSERLPKESAENFQSLPKKVQKTEKKRDFLPFSENFCRFLTTVKNLRQNQKETSPDSHERGDTKKTA